MNGVPFTKQTKRSAVEPTDEYTGLTEEELSEMRDEFGEGTVMVNALTGDTFVL